MGNRHSGYERRGAEPTSRSFSWQPDPAFAPIVGHLPNGQQSQFVATSSFPSNNPYPTGGGSMKHNKNHRSNSIGNGSVIRDDEMFGGVHSMNGGIQPPIDQNPPQTDQNSPYSPNINSRPGTSDSGYFSDPKMRSRLRGSRLSLNEAVFSQQGLLPEMMPPQPHHINGYVGHASTFHFPHPPPHFVQSGRPPMPPPPPPGQMYPPFRESIFIGQPFLPNPKKAKKLMKKQKKLAAGRRESVKSDLLMPMPHGPPCNFLPPRTFPYRTQSIDNIAMCDVTQPFRNGPPPSDVQQRRFSSQLDLSMPPPWGAAHFPSPLPPGPVPANVQSKGRKEKKGKKEKGSLGTTTSVRTENTSASSGKGSSRRSREPTHFEEEAIIVEGSLTREIQPQMLQTDQRTLRDQQTAAIYETLKAERTKLVATAQVEATRSDAAERNLELLDTKPLKVSAEAEAVLRRNAELFPSEIGSENAAEMGKDEVNVVVKETAKLANTANYANMAKENEEKLMSDVVNEWEIEPVLNPVLERFKPKRPKEFEPLEAWRSIDVTEIVLDRQPERNHTSPCPINDENISVRLVPVPPSCSEVHGEPIYFEYDEKLPDFKKRLIETGTFDFPEKFQQSKMEDSVIFPKEHRTTACDNFTNHFSDEDSKLMDVTRVRAQPPEMNSIGSSKKSTEKGSLRRLKDSLSTIVFHQRSKSAERQREQQDNYLQQGQHRSQYRPTCDAQYRSSGSLTPSTANIKAGDSSEIDFSWVIDLENKFRRENGPVLESPYCDRQSEFSLREAAAHSTPSFANNRRMIPMQHQQISPRPAYQMQKPETIYFGCANGLAYQVVPDNSRNDREEELSKLDSNVKLKAAMFEQEAARNQQRCRPAYRQDSQLHCRSRSTPKVEPEYLEYYLSDTNRANNYQNGSNSPGKGLPRYYAIDDECEIGMNNYVPNGNVPQFCSADDLVFNRQMIAGRSPSERKIHKAEMQKREQWMHSGMGMPMINGQQQRVHQQSRLAPYDLQMNGDGQCPPMGNNNDALQRARVYDATEYYRQHYLSDRNKNGDQAINESRTKKKGGAKQNQMEMWNGAPPNRYASQPMIANGHYRNGNNWHK